VNFDQLHPALQHHIVNSLGWRSLRPLQAAAIEPLLAGEDAILLAPTAGGKTEAAVLPLFSRMLFEDWQGLGILYVCPIKALLNNLADRLEHYAGLLGRTVTVWHGDTSEGGRKRTRLDPPDVLLTTPESLEAQLVSSKTDNIAFFGKVRAIVIDEVHAFAGDDRGWHLLGVLSRLEAIVGRPIQRVGCSATVGNPDDLLRWLSPPDRVGRVLAPAAPTTAPTEVRVDFVGSLDNAALVIASLHRGMKRLVFCDSRAKVEDLAVRLRARGVETFVSHSSLSLTERRDAERAFAEARDCVIVATSTLELGIDVGDLDHVVQIDAPSTVASFLQRIGRTGRRAGSTRNCLFLALSEDALVRATALVSLWERGWVEPIVPPPVPLHILAQQLMGLLLQERGITRADWQRHLATFLAQSGLAASDGSEILANMLATGLLHEDSGRLWFGELGEATFGRRHFSEVLAVFTAEPLFKVLHGRREVGHAHPMSFRGESRTKPLALGGRNWRITDVDWRRSTVQVEPTDEQGRIRFRGDAVPLSFEFCNACREVLAGDGVPAWLTRRGTECLLEARHEHSFLDPASTTLTGTPDKATWWTFGGLVANQRLADALHRRLGTASSASNFTISIHDASGWSELADSIEQLRISSVAVDRGLPEDLAALRALPLKFRECLGDVMLARVHDARSQATPALAWILARPVVVSSTRT